MRDVFAQVDITGKRKATTTSVMAYEDDDSLSSPIKEPNDDHDPLYEPPNSPATSDIAPFQYFDEVDDNRYILHVYAIHSIYKMQVDDNRYILLVNAIHSIYKMQVTCDKYVLYNVITHN